MAEDMTLEERLEEAEGEIDELRAVIAGMDAELTWLKGARRINTPVAVSYSGNYFYGNNDTVASNLTF